MRPRHPAEILYYQPPTAEGYGLTDTPPGRSRSRPNTLSAGATTLDNEPENPFNAWLSHRGTANCVPVDVDSSGTQRWEYMDGGRR